ncbi:unnamed protein product [Rotaria socialis]|uniref:C-type lectin domain-containing protein n=1 Tax=Rotaria socialis TaxID=392032 RepID=A0A821THW4_9BILA|nr:unnamed protein product [Rotaria socialis]CAF3503434.1 unnamed protein product [Rotaria socialis]CAF4491986.1 unnamed protein product [Rotaria socialis]CAF4871761.1 unnamed protein product [Rotaria socialis]
MPSLQFNFILFLLTVEYVQQIASQCPAPFINDSITDFCYYYTSNNLSWSDGYNQCLNNNTDALLIQIFTMQDFSNLKNANISGKDPFWIGANNFASFRDSHWHWLDGSVVSDSVITWCPNSTYDVAIGTYCAAYDSTLKCVNNYLCSTLLPAPCVITKNNIAQQTKSILESRLLSTNTCANLYEGDYANWWTYSILLLNWFILFCFILYLSNHFNINKRAVMLTIFIVILSFMMIIAFSILWGVQYQNIIEIPLVIVTLGSAASAILLINILILVSNRTRVQKWMPPMILVILTIIIECLLMLGLILCTAYCSAYITLPSTTLDKDIIASLLSALVAAITVLSVHAILALIDQDHVYAAASNKTSPNNPNTVTGRQTLVPRPITANRSDRVDRTTSPVDERILNEFYTDHPKDVHQYNLEGRQYVVYEGIKSINIDAYRKELAQAMLSQETQGLHEAIFHAKNSSHATALAEEIQQAESLLNRLK